MRSILRKDIIMKYIFMIAAFFAGTTLPLQSSINSGVSSHLGHPLYGAAVSFLGGVLISLLIMVFSPVGFPPLHRFTGINWIYFTGGIYGLIVVISVINSVPYAGVASTLSCVIAGQLVMSVFFDHFGWLGIDIIKISPHRIAGVVLLLSGVYLIQR